VLSVADSAGIMRIARRNQTDPLGTRYGGNGRSAQFFTRFFQGVDALPGVQASGAISFLPLTGLGAATSMEIVGKPKPPKGQEPVTDVRVVTHDHLEAMGVPLLKGRLFNEQDAANSVVQRRLTMLLLTIFAGAALLLAAVGIYGVIAYSVTQRTQEIGIRMALGAQRGDVLRMVVKQAIVLAAVGIAAGGTGGLALTRLMEGLLFQVKPADPLTFVAVSAVLAAVAILASYIPGRRATRVDPVIALRAE